MKNTILSFLAISIISSANLIAQSFSGFITCMQTGQPVEYANIGIVGKNVGTVSNDKGYFSLQIEEKYNNDSLLFTCIGYRPYLIKVSEFRKLQNHSISLEEKVTQIQTVLVLPKKYAQKKLGVTTRNKSFSAGFSDNQLGYEMGIMMKVKKTAFIQTVNLNINQCTYDSILYRLNIYKVKGKMNFENILTKPIYIKLPKSMLNKTVTIDLTSYNLMLQGYFLVALEHIKDMGPGILHFSCSLTQKTYYRKTSQGAWDTAPIGVSISVDAKVEK
jgi:hypothetical protein